MRWIIGHVKMDFTSGDYNWFPNRKVRRWQALRTHAWCSDCTLPELSVITCCFISSIFASLAAFKKQPYSFVKCEGSQEHLICFLDDLTKHHLLQGLILKAGRLWCCTPQNPPVSSCPTLGIGWELAGSCPSAVWMLGLKASRGVEIRTCSVPDIVLIRATEKHGCLSSSTPGRLLP